MPNPEFCPETVAAGCRVIAIRRRRRERRESRDRRVHFFGEQCLAQLRFEVQGLH